MNEYRFESRRLFSGGFSMVGSDINKYFSFVTELNAPDNVINYFTYLLKSIQKEYDIAFKARAKKLDPTTYPESIFTWDMAERIERMFNIPNLAEFIREKSKNVSREKLALLVLDEFLSGGFGAYNINDLVDLGVRIALAILTEGMTVAPTEGIRKIVLKKSAMGPYISIYFAGPIRAAGGTEAGLIVVYADYIRQKLGLARYVPMEKPGEDEVSRYVEELRLYERFVGRFQFHVSDEAIKFTIRNIPIEINGVATDDIEVVMNRDLSRVETNKLRGGALRVINDGIIGRARKLYGIIEELGIDGWEWLKELIEKKEENSFNNNANGMNDTNDKIVSEVIIGRPVVSLSSNITSFRVRYGRMSNMGISAVGIHPAAFPVLEYFLVIGSQIKVNLPGKGAITVPCPICSPPVVKLENGSVIKLTDEKMARRYRKRIKEILFLGDIMISFGDFLENNYPLVPSPYVPEWWYQEFKNALATNQDALSYINKIGVKQPEHAFDEIDFYSAYVLSQYLQIPLHPRYTLRWSLLNKEEIKKFIRYIGEARINKDSLLEWINPDPDLLDVLDKLLVTYALKDNKLVLDDIEISKLFILLLNLFVENPSILEKEYENTCELISEILGIKQRDVIGKQISARFGRPEKTKPRELSPSVHVLFPISKFGGSKRDLIKASELQRYVILNLSARFCEKCNLYTYHVFCKNCGSPTKQLRYCFRCKRTVDGKNCPECGGPTSYLRPYTIDIKKEITDRCKTFNLPKPHLIKGVEGLLNEEGIPEELAKGIIRAIYGISIFKDGTVRIDLTNAPLHQFRPKDIGLSVEKAKELGYDASSENDVLDLYPQDIIIPIKAAKYLVKVCKYMDTLLTKVYGLEPYYNIRKISDLIGTIVVGLSPHTSVGIIGRIIGFTNSQVLYAHPLWHAAKRRDCDGDEDSIMLLLDVLINFSVRYLPMAPGGKMDAPIFISPVLHPDEVDTQVHNMDVTDFYPVEFYLATLVNEHPKNVVKKGYVDIYESLLNTEREYYPLSSFGYPELLELKENESTYSKLKTMKKKLDKQIGLMEKIFDKNELSYIIRSIIKKHILPDIIGNLRAFSSQRFRCSKCNKIIRRPLLSNSCPRCGGNLIQTVHVKNVVKYLDLAKELMKYVKDDKYLLNRFELLEKEIAQTISSYSPKRISLTDFIE